MRPRGTQPSHPRGSPWGLDRTWHHRPARRGRHLEIPGSVLPVRGPDRLRDGMHRVALTTIHCSSYLLLCSLLRGYVLFIILLILLSKK
jgi:hypothetical protein